MFFIDGKRDIYFYKFSGFIFTYPKKEIYKDFDKIQSGQMPIGYDIG